MFAASQEPQSRLRTADCCRCKGQQTRITGRYGFYCSTCINKPVRSQSFPAWNLLLMASECYPGWFKRKAEDFWRWFSGFLWSGIDHRDLEFRGRPCWEKTPSPVHEPWTPQDAIYATYEFWNWHKMLCFCLLLLDKKTRCVALS